MMRDTCAAVPSFELLCWSHSSRFDVSVVWLQAAGLIGCFKFLEGFYLLLVTQRRYHGTVCGRHFPMPSSS